MKIRKALLIVFLIFLSNTSLFSQSGFYSIDSIREIRLYFKEPNWRHLLDSLFSVGDGSQKLKEDVSIDGHFYKNVGVRYKGYSSYSPNYKKNPFHITLDECVSGQNYEGYTQIKLSNIINDPSCVREALSYEIAAKYMPESRANFARLFVNDTLIGLYTNVESVNDIFTEEHYHSKGNPFFKASPSPLVYPYGQNGNLAYHGPDSSAYYHYYEMESHHGWEELVNLTDILNNDTANLGNVLNIDRTLWMHAIDYTLLNLDSYIGYSQNYYLYQDDNGRFNPIIWDLNMSFGSFRYSDGTTTNLSIAQIKQLNPLGILYFTSTQFSPRPLIKNLLVNSTYRRMFIAHMRTILDENIKNGEYYARGKAMQNTIDSCVQQDVNKFYSYSYFVKDIDTTVGPTANQYPGIKDVMEAHAAYLDNFPGFQGAPNITAINHQPEYPEKNSNTWITAKVANANEVYLAYRFMSDGIFQKIEMFDDGNHADGIAGDSIYGASVTVGGHVIQYYIYAQNDSAGRFSPERAEYEFYSIQPKISIGDLAINELMSVNESTATDQDGEYDPWIELLNTTGEDLHMKTIFLTDDRSVPSKWPLPDTVIKANSFLIIWADNNILQQGLHANFRLSKSGGLLFLSHADGEIIDSVTYGPQITGKTVGRYPNGFGPFVYMVPTFAKNNYPGTTPQNNFLIYPNPVRETIYVEFNNHDGPVSTEIINTVGQSVKKEQFVFDSAADIPANESIDISSLRKGLYCIKLIIADQTYVKKFVVY